MTFDLNLSFAQILDNQFHPKVASALINSITLSSNFHEFAKNFNFSNRAELYESIGIPAKKAQCKRIVKRLIRSHLSTEGRRLLRNAVQMQAGLDGQSGRGTLYPRVATVLGRG